MATAEERELLDAELQREVAGALDAAMLGALGDTDNLEAVASDLIAELRKRRLVIYRRAVHTLPPGLHQITVEEVADGSALGEPPAGGKGASFTGPESSPSAESNSLAPIVQPMPDCARRGCGHGYYEHEGDSGAEASDAGPCYTMKVECACERYVAPEAPAAEPTPEYDPPSAADIGAGW